MSNSTRQFVSFALLWGGLGCSTLIGIDGDFSEQSTSVTGGGGAGAIAGAGKTGDWAGAAGDLGGAVVGAGRGPGGSTADGDAGSNGRDGGGLSDGDGGGLSDGDGDGGGLSGGGTKGSAGATGVGGGSGGTPPESCKGFSSNGVCWYLSASGKSCTDTCGSHDGNAPNAASFVGVVAQGGSLAACTTLMDGLAAAATAPTAATRSDGAGLGCHVYDGKGYWLVSPAYSASARVSDTKLVCGCVR